MRDTFLYRKALIFYLGLGFCAGGCATTGAVRSPEIASTPLESLALPTSTIEHTTAVAPAARRVLEVADVELPASDGERRASASALDDESGTPWESLVSSYACAAIEYPELKAVTLAQWILESGWGRSGLSRKAYNFGGLKYSSRLGVEAERYRYRGGTYCRFPSPGHFIDGYWKFIDSRIYRGWRDAARLGPDAYMRFIVNRGYVGGGRSTRERYMRQIRSLLPKAQRLLESARAGVTN